MKSERQELRPHAEFATGRNTIWIIRLIASRWPSLNLPWAGAEVSFLNYSFELSNHSNTTRKILNINFSITENWFQYLLLLKWFELQDFTRYDQNRTDTVLLDLKKDGLLRNYRPDRLREVALRDPARIRIIPRRGRF